MENPVDGGSATKYEFARGMERHTRAQDRVPHASAWTTERWIDDEFGWEIRKHLVATAWCEQRMRVPTLFGFVTLDFHVRVGKLRVGFLYDGLTAAPGFAGIWQDAAMVGANAVDVVYRLRQSDFDERLADILYLVSRADLRLFSERGLLNLESLASAPARRCRVKEELQVHYPEPRSEEDCDPSGDPAGEETDVEPILRPDGECLHLVRRVRERLEIPYRYARDAGLRSVEQAMERYGAAVFAEADD